MKAIKRSGTIVNLTTSTFLVLLVVFVASAVSSLAIEKGMLELKQGKLVAVIIEILSSAAAAYVCTRRTKHRKLYTAILSAACIIMAMLIMKQILAPQSPICIDWRIVVLFAASVCSGIMGSQKKERKR